MHLGCPPVFRSAKHMLIHVKTRCKEAHWGILDLTITTPTTSCLLVNFAFTFGILQHQQNTTRTIPVTDERTVWLTLAVEETSERLSRTCWCLSQTQNQRSVVPEVSVVSIFLLVMLFASLLAWRLNGSGWHSARSCKTYNICYNGFLVDGGRKFQGPLYIQKLHTPPCLQSKLSPC